MAASARRQLAAMALALGVVAWHGWVGEQLVDLRLNPPSVDAALRRIEVTFVRELQPSTPPAVVAVRRPAARVAALPVPLPPEPAPSAPPPAEPVPMPPPMVVEQDAAADETDADAAESAAGLDLSLPSDPAGEAFEWPPSTRLSYALTGHYRGPVEGSARVEWLRDGARYQVHLDVTIGASLAPLITRQMSSEGRLGPQGLVPRWYQERTQVLFRDPFQATLQFGDQTVLLAKGRQAPRPSGMQDSVSQFVQMTWAFTRDPSLLTAGRELEFPLALPSGVQPWTYVVQPAQTLWTPMGPVNAVRLLPQRVARRGGDLVAEPWFAPSLQYLPVRIVIRQDEATFIDLMIERLPQQSAPPPGPPVAPAQISEKRAP